MPKMEFRRHGGRVIMPTFLLAILFSLTWNSIQISKQGFMTPSYMLLDLPSSLSWGLSRRSTVTTSSKIWSSPLVASTKQNVQFLWGIQSTNDKLGRDRRQLIRSTYLGQVPNSSNNSTTFPPLRICSLLDLLLLPTTTNGGNSPNETTIDDCQIAYSFVIIGNQEGASLDKKRILRENAKHNDVLLLPNNDEDPKMTGPADSELSSPFSFCDKSHTQLAQSLAWFHFATTNHHLAETVRFDYIAKLDDDVILLPDWFRSMAPNRTRTTSNNKNSTPTATWIESGSVFASTRTNELQTEFCALNRNFCHDFIGKFYFMSPPIARHILKSVIDGTFCQDCNQTLLHSELLLHPNDDSNVIRMHLSSWSSSSSGGVDYSAVPLLPGGGALPVQINVLPRVLRRRKPYHWWKSWQTYENAVSQWDRLQSKYNSSVVHVSGKFARNDTVLFHDQVTFSTTFNMMLGGLSSDQSISHHKFPDYILQDPTWTNHTAFLTNATITDRGAGYWFWKGPLIHHQLVENHNLHEGDFVVYTDIDVHDHWQWMYHLLETMIRSNKTLALYQTNFLERNYCKRDVLEAYCGSELQRADGSRQYSANFIVARKSSGTIQFVQDWMQGMANYQLINDEPSILATEQKGLKEHRHDQAILSAMLKCKYNETGKTQFDGAFTLRRWTVQLFTL
jgi:hypothetical protein